MRKIRTAKIGKLVYVPVSCFAPLRRGWNGWIFRCGTIEEILTGKNGEKGVKVRFCSNAEPYMESTKNFIMSAVFEYDYVALDQKNYTHQNELESNGEHVCKSNDIEFLAANGFIN